MNFVIIYGSVRTERQGIKVARYIESQIRSRGHTTVLIDPMIYRLPLLDRMYKEYKGDAPSPLRTCGFLQEGRRFRDRERRI